MLRKAYRKILLDLANISIRKYNTSIIVIYGWDWSEGLREATYNLLYTHSNLRRNTRWIDWDMGLPLFVLGYPYSRGTSRLRISYYIIKACLNLLRPVKYKNNYIIVSLHAKSQVTLDYWRQLSGVKCLIILPVRPEGELNLNNYIPIASDSLTIVDLQGQKLPTAVDNNLLNNGSYLRLNPFQKQLTNYLAKVQATFLRKLEFDFRVEDLVDAVIKIDWSSFFLERVRTNLKKEANVDKQ